MSSLALSVLQPTTIFQPLLCLQHATADYTNSPFLSTTMILLLNRLLASASSQPDHRPTSRGDVSAVASVRPNQLSTYQISLKKPLRLLFRFSALHYTYTHTEACGEYSRSIQTHLHNFPRFLTEHLLLC